MHINQSKCGIVFYISFHSINIPASVGFSDGIFFDIFYIFVVVLGLVESHNPRKSCRAAYNNIRRAFVAFCWVLKLLPICLWLATILVVSFLSLPRFYFPASVPALSIYGQPWSMGWARTPVWALDGWRFGGFFCGPSSLHWHTVHFVYFPVSNREWRIGSGSDGSPGPGRSCRCHLRSV